MNCGALIYCNMCVCVMVQMYLLNASTTCVFVFVQVHDSWVVRDDLLTVVC